MRKPAWKIKKINLWKFDFHRFRFACFGVFAVALFFALTSFVLGWTGPSGNPPLGNGSLNSSAGNIGLGTTTPPYFFTVATGTDAMFGLFRTGASYPAIFRLGTDSGFVMNVGNSDLLTLKSGNVGIGTTAPVAADSSARTLQVGNEYILQNVIGNQVLLSNNAYYDGSWKRATADYATAIRMYNGEIDFHLAASGAARSAISSWDTSSRMMTILNSGNVGIGTTGPGANLDVGGIVRIGTLSGSCAQSGGWALELCRDSTWAYVGSYNRSISAYQPLYLYASKISLNGGGEGNVGIATTTPAYPLTVAGTIYSSSGGIRFPDATTQTTAYLGGTQTVTAGNVSAGIFGSNTGFGNYTFGTSTNPILYIDNTNSRVGIGTTGPAGKFDVMTGSNKAVDITDAALLAGDCETFSTCLRLSGNVHSQIKLEGRGGGGYAAGGLRLAFDPSGTNYGRLYTTGAQPLGIGTNGADVITILSSGNVGIGTASPGRQLELGGASDAYIQLTRASTAYQSTLGFNTGATNDWLIRTITNSDLNIYSYGTATNVLTILKSNGNVGIGTASPGALLDVNGSARFENNNIRTSSVSYPMGFFTGPTGTGGAMGRFGLYGDTAFVGDNLYYNNIAWVGDYPTNAGAMWLMQGGAGTFYTRAAGASGITAAMTISNNGNVNIPGTLTAGGFSGPLTGTENAANISAGTFGSNTNYGSYQFGNPAILYVDNTNARVGIGTAGPARKLDVAGDIRINQYIYSPASYSGFLTDAGGALPVKVGSLAITGSYADIAPTNGLYVAGNVGVGTTGPTRLTSLSATANTYLSFNNGATEKWVIGRDTAAPGFLIYDSAAAAYRLVIAETSGNVGIGNTSPAEKLDVTGNIKTSAAILGQGGTYVTSLPWNNISSAPAGYVKLVTPIVYNESNMFDLHIVGYDYSSAKNIDSHCYGYAYSAGGFINYGCQSTGNSTYPIEIGTELRSGSTVVVVRIGTPTSAWYYQHFTAEYRGWNAKLANTFSWVTGEITPAQTGNTHKVLVNDSAGTITLGAGGSIAFPDATTQTTAYLGSSQITSAGNVSAGTFGSNTNYGNYQFGSPAILYIDNTNARVGIGTTGPAGKFDVMTGSNKAVDITDAALLAGDCETFSTCLRLSGNVHSQIKLEGRGGGGYAAGGLRLAFDPSGTNYGRLYTTGAQPLGIGTNGADVITILSSGNVGIATTTPTNALSVQGSANISGTLTAGTISGSYSGTITAPNVTAGVFAAGNFAFPSSLGVATSSQVGLPQALSVYGGGYFSGNVGIGTTGPQGKLEVQGAGYTPANQLILSQSEPTRYYGVIGTNVPSGATLLTFGTRSDNTNYFDTMVLKNGNVGIGTANPANRLYVTDSSANAAQYITQNGTGDLFAAAAGASERFRITNAGNVGIGTTNPGYPLEVKGNIFNTNITNGSLGLTGDLPGYGNGLYPTLKSTGRYIYLSSNGTYSGYIDGSGGTSQLYSSLYVNNLFLASGGVLKFADNTTQTTAYLGGSQTVTAPNVTAGVFGAGNFAFPSSLGVATTTQVGLPQTFSVYGGGYFSGNVGIGTVSPGAKLDVIGPTTGTGETIRAGGGGDVVLASGGSLFFDDNYSYATGNYIRPIAANTQAFFTSGAERMRITSTGNVGIGMTGPAHKLEVAGNIGVTAGNNIYARYTSDGSYASSLSWSGLQLGNNGPNYIVAGRTAVGGALVFMVNNTADYVYGGGNGTTAMYIASSGNVGIATTTPGYPLTVAGTIYSSSGGFRFPDNTTQTTAYLGGSQIIAAGNVSAGYFGSNTGGGGNYQFPSSISVGTSTAPTGGIAYFNGNVGIGTASPGVKLDVAGTVQGSGQGRFTGWTTGGESGLGFEIGVSAGIGYGYVYNRSTSAYGTMNLMNALQIVGGGGTVAITNGLTTGGNVGIGTTTPTNALSVQGNVDISGNVTLGGTVNLPHGIQGYSTPGSYTFTVPFRVTNIDIKGWGAGGGGGGGYGGGSGTGGGGGGGGGYGETIISVTPGQSISLTVGTGGSGGGNPQGAGVSGGSTIVGGGIVSGGGGGSAGVSVGVVPGGAGGTSTAAFNVAGNAGGVSGTNSGSSGFCLGGYGGGAYGTQPIYANSATGTSPGGGGAGGSCNPGSVGGNGANGLVIIQW